MIWKFNTFYTCIKNFTHCVVSNKTLSGVPFTIPANKNTLLSLVEFDFFKSTYIIRIVVFYKRPSPIFNKKRYKNFDFEAYRHQLSNELWNLMSIDWEIVDHISSLQ